MIILPIGLRGQQTSVTISGAVKERDSGEPLPFVNIQLKRQADSVFVAGTISNDAGRFTLTDVQPGDYLLEVSYLGFQQNRSPLFVGASSAFIDIGAVLLEAYVQQLDEVVVSTKQNAVAGTMNKKTYTLDDNVSQSGGSVLQSMNNLPGITTQDNQVQLRGNSQVTDEHPVYHYCL